MTLTPLAWEREAQRCEVQARLALAEYEQEQARRWRGLARYALKRAREGMQ